MSAQEYKLLRYINTHHSLSLHRVKEEQGANIVLYSYLH